MKQCVIDSIFHCYKENNKNKLHLKSLYKIKVNLNTVLKYWVKSYWFEKTAVLIIINLSKYGLSDKQTLCVRYWLYG